MPGGTACALPRLTAGGKLIIRGGSEVATETCPQAHQATPGRRWVLAGYTRSASARTWRPAGAR